MWTQFHATSHRAIEAGAELIGYNHPTWLMLARQFDLGLTVLTTEEAFTSLDLEMPLSLDGQLLSPKQVKQVYDEMEPVIASICSERSPGAPAGASRRRSLGAGSPAGTRDRR